MTILPTHYQKRVAIAQGKDYRRITQVLEVPLPRPGPGRVLVRNYYAGVNASDINLTSGAYGTSPTFPMDLGVEAVGVVVAVGDGVPVLREGDPVAYLRAGAYGEYALVPYKAAYLLPSPSPEAVPLVASAMTAAVGLHHVGEMRPAADIVVVTGAAGGTGQFAVQLAKLAGNHVVAVCGSAGKAAMLETLGADRVINHRKERLSDVLAREYPGGVDLVYESVGGETFDTCVHHLAPRGRLLVVGYISEYRGQPERVLAPRIYTKLLWKSASIRGFISSMYPDESREQTARMIALWQAKALVSHVDATAFKGLEAIPDALDYLYSGENLGKVIVKLADDLA